MSFDFEPTLVLFNSIRLRKEVEDIGIAGFGGCTFTEALSTGQSPIVGINHYYALHQVHGSALVHPKDPEQLTNIAPAINEALHSFPESADGWFLSKDDWLESGIAFCIKTADCMPLFLFGSQYIAMLHAGWRGLQQGLILRALEQFKVVGDVPRYAALGPCADPALYEVGEEFTKIFPESTGQSSPDRYTLNMYQEAIRQLEEGGFSGTLESSNIHTISDTRLFSYRSSQLKSSEGTVQSSDAHNKRNYAVIGFPQAEDILNR